MFILDTTVGVEQDGGAILRRQMGQHRRMGKSHHRETTLYNDVLPRLRCNSFWRDSNRGLFRGIREVKNNKNHRDIERKTSQKETRDQSIARASISSIA